MAMKLLVIEDEKRMFNQLRKMLLKIEPNVVIEGPVTSVAELREILEDGNRYDLILSDVRINGGTCFNAFEKQKPTVPVIFITAYDEYALKAFRNNGVCPKTRRGRRIEGSDGESQKNAFSTGGYHPAPRHAPASDPKIQGTLPDTKRRPVSNRQQFFHQSFRG